MPTISVIISTFNRAGYIGRAIDSVLGQTYEDYEVIVIDDGSTDDTQTVLQPYQGRIRYVHQYNAGVSAARNRGIREASAPWIAFLDSDDTWMPTKLESQMVCVAETGAEICFTDFWVVDDRGLHKDRAWSAINPQEPKYVPLLHPFELYAYNSPRLHISTTLVRKEILERIGSFDVRRRVGEDTDLLFHALQQAKTRVFIGSVLMVHDRTRSRQGLSDRRTLESRRLYSNTQIRVLMEAYYFASGLCSPAASDLRRRIAYALSRLAMYACMEGKYREGRCIARESLRFTRDLRTAIRALAALVCPRILQRLCRRRWMRTGSIRPSQAIPGRTAELAAGMGQQDAYGFSDRNERTAPSQGENKDAHLVEKAADDGHVATGAGAGTAIPETADRSRGPEGKVRTPEGLRKELLSHRACGQRIVFTNGCFDVIHRGHVEYLRFCKDQGDIVVLGLNSDTSVRRIKGPERPINNQQERAAVLAGLEAVDYIVIFDEPDPLNLIMEVRPDVLVKGADWAPEKVIGREFVESYGGRLTLAPLVQGRSSTAVIQKIRACDANESGNVSCPTPSDRVRADGSEDATASDSSMHDTAPPADSSVSD